MAEQKSDGEAGCMMWFGLLIFLAWALSYGKPSILEGIASWLTK